MPLTRDTLAMWFTCNLSTNRHTATTSHLSYMGLAGPNPSKPTQRCHLFQAPVQAILKMARRNDTVPFYHYTDAAGKDGILQSGFIESKPAGDRHAHFGQGTYGTSLPPSAGQQQISDNNWKAAGQHYANNGKTDWAIKVEVPRNMVDRVGTEQGRDVLVYRGGDLDLDYHNYRVVRGPRY